MSKLTVTQTDDPDNSPSWIFAWDGEPVGQVTWGVHGEWWWTPLGKKVRESVRIDVDPEQSARFISERQSIARMDETIRDVMLAELEGRLRIFRDETLDMALMYGRAKARSIGQGADRMNTPVPRWQKEVDDGKYNV